MKGSLMTLSHKMSQIMLYLFITTQLHNIKLFHFTLVILIRDIRHVLKRNI